MTARAAAPTREDRVQFELWARAQAERVYTVLRHEIWNGAALARRGKRVPDDIDAWKGSWFTVRPYVTAEFREGVEDGTIPRPTLTEWAARNHAEREAERAHVAEAAGPEALASLAYLAELLERRGEFIATARAAGESWETVCAASGLSRSQASKLLADREAAQRVAALAASAIDADEPF